MRMQFNIKEKVEKIKAWAGAHPALLNLCTRATAFALISFFWVYLITGSPVVSCLYLAIAAATICLREVVQRKPKIVFTLIFLGMSALAFGLTLIIATTAKAFLSIAIWWAVGASYVARRNLKEWIAGAIIPFCIMMYAEFMQFNTRLAWNFFFRYEDIQRFGYVLGILLVTFVVFFFTQLFNNKRIGYFTSVGLLGLLSIVNFFVVSITDQAFTISDLKIATTAAGVLNSQKLTVGEWVRFGVGVLMLAAFFVAIYFVYNEKNKKKKLQQRIATIGSLILVSALLFMESNFLYNSVLLFNGNQKYSYITYFYIMLDTGIKMPDGTENYVIEDKNDEGDHAPNVIIIMNEAFSDIGTTLGLSLNEDPLEYFHSLQEQYPNGIAYASVRGNNTCSSEWEVLSGSPTALTTKGAIIYQDNCKPMRSLVSLFNSRGYTTVGLHPYYAFGYNRENMYNALGFDQTYFMDDLPSDLDTIRDFITDEEDYKQLIRLYEENEANGDAPFFCFNITMQNHGGYDNMQSDTIHTTEGNTHAALNTYLSVLNYSDDALKMLISYFETVEEDTIILFFGDHQPLVDKEIYEEVFGKPYNEMTLEETMKLYEVPYLIWANYDMNEEAAPEFTSHNYLSNILFEVGNIPKSTWLNMVDEYQEVYPVISSNATITSNGEAFATDALVTSKAGDETDKLTLYKNYAYGILYGVPEKSITPPDVP